jgi:hypothetical protein
VQHDLTAALAERFDFGFCADVLEHVPPADVERVLWNIGTASKRLYLNVSTVPDVMGALIGEPLHLTVESPYWWHDTLERIGFRIDWSECDEQSASFWCSLYANEDDLFDRSSLNTPDEVVRENVRKNLALGLREIEPHQPQDTLVYLLAGGPSLADHEAEIVEAGKRGVPCVTMNGTYGWLLQRGIKPAAQVMVDARTFNRRFVDPVVPGCKYLISSQCDHEVLKALPAEQTWLWHSANSGAVADEMPKGREWWPVHGGTTIATRALILLAMLGFRRVEIFGLDSCLRGKDHHAYAQPENDGDFLTTVTVGGREFRVAAWHVLQASDFQGCVRKVLAQIPDFQMIVHGDGLIAHMLQHAAELAGRKH